MPTCLACGKATYAIDPKTGLCNECQAELGDECAARQADLEASASIILTTETAHNLPVTDRLGIISAECVIGMHLFKDIAAAFRDTFGGRSQSMQEVLREARITALDDLRREAYELGADAVVGIALNYSEISGGGKSMLFLVASGTAVSIQSEL